MASDDAPTVLRYDTPDRLRQLDAHYRTDAHTSAAQAFLLVFLATAFVLIFYTRNVVGALTALALMAGTGGWLYNARRNAQQINTYRTPVRQGASLIGNAHKHYGRLDFDNRVRVEPLLEAIYRLAAYEVRGDQARARILAAMRERVYAIARLVDAEDRVRMAADAPMLADRDDLDALAIWQQALSEVEAKIAEDV